VYLLILLLLSPFSHASKEIEDAKRSVQSLIRPLMAGTPRKRPPGTEKFRVDACPQQKINWMDVLMMRKEVTLRYEFKPGCDIQGVITPKVFSPFPVSLDLRNMISYSHVEAQNRITADLQSRPILNLEMRQGVLSGKNKVKFEADYRVQINPLAKDPVEKNLGGEIRILEINGKKASIKEKILVN
jgi:hypothetical protein